MLKVLLIDDELTTLEDLESMLGGDERIGIVGAYQDPYRLLNDLPDLQADCLFMDIEMPGMNGIELAERIQSSGVNMEIIFVTAYNHYATQAFEVHAMDYLLKPIRPERMTKAIERMIGERGGKREAEVTEGKCSINSFGFFEVKVGTNRVKWTRSKSRELLAYMLQYEGKWISKYKLCDEQWGGYDSERALAYLQTAIYALRKNLKEAGCTEVHIEYAEDKYRLIVADVLWDVREFEEAYKHFMEKGSEQAATLALACYRGEYLEDEDWPWAHHKRGAYIRRYDRMKYLLQ